MTSERRDYAHTYHNVRAFISRVQLRRTTRRRRHRRWRSKGPAGGCRQNDRGKHGLKLHNRNHGSQWMSALSRKCWTETKLIENSFIVHPFGSSSFIIIQDITRLIITPAFQPRSVPFVGCTYMQVRCLQRGGACRIIVLTKIQTCVNRF